MLVPVTGHDGTPPLDPSRVVTLAISLGVRHGQRDRIRPHQYRRQSFDLQIEALTAAECLRVFTETASSRSFKKSDELDLALDYLNAGDTSVVWRLDRPGRNVLDLVQL